MTLRYVHRERVQVSLSSQVGLGERTLGVQIWGSRSGGLDRLRRLCRKGRNILSSSPSCRPALQFQLSLQYREETVITYLQPGVEYCVTVSVETLFNSNSVPSDAHCAFTSPPPTGSRRSRPPSRHAVRLAWR